METTYVLIPQNCTGCRTCELACAMVKGENGKLGKSRIRIHTVGPERYMQMNCLQCVDAACVRVCPVLALTRNAQTGAVEIDEARCIHCSLCAVACPFGHMHFDEMARIPLKCDLCGGDPACAKFCPHKALEVR